MSPMVNFSVPNRGLTSAKGQACSRSTTSARGEDVVFFEPVFNRSTKAERILGPAEMFSDKSHGRKLNKSTLLKLRKKTLSFKSSAVSTLKGDIAADNVEECNGPQSQALSSLLGCPHIVSGNMASMTSSRSQQYNLSSTPPHYDLSSFPLAISQQMSASSSRDIALRKGMNPALQSPVNAPPSRPAVEILDGELRRPLEEQKRRPPHLDLSRMFHKPQTPIRPVMSPQHATSSPSLMKVAPDGHHSPLSSRPKWSRWRSDKPKGPSNHINELPANSPRPRDQDPFLVDGYARKLGVDMDIWSAARKSGEVPKNASIKDAPEATMIGQFSPHNSPNTLSRGSSGSVVTLTSEASVKEVILHEPFKSHPSSRKPSSSSTRQKHGNPVSNSKACRKHHTDLCSQSVLALSSSEDEVDEVSEIPKRVHSSSNSKVIPNALSSSTELHQSTVLVSSVSHPGIQGKLDGKSSYTPKSIHARIPKALSAPNGSPKSYSNLGAKPLRTQTLVDQKFYETKVEAVEPVVPKYALGPKTNDGARKSLRKSRVMAVTREEERLLEAMREKRASMRQADFAKGFDVAMEKGVHPSSRRPQTADLGKRSSSLLEAEIASFPTPPSSKIVKPTRSSHSTMSSEDLFQFPEIYYADESPLPALRNSFLEAPIASTYLNYNPSDLLSSPSPSQASPLTPPPDHLSSMYGQEHGQEQDHLDESLSSGLSPHRKRDRDSRDRFRYPRRSASSEILLLEGLRKEIREEVLSHWLG